jgi:hypothetical protein
LGEDDLYKQVEKLLRKKCSVDELREFAKKNEISLTLRLRQGLLKKIEIVFTPLGSLGIYSSKGYTFVLFRSSLTEDVKNFWREILSSLDFLEIKIDRR